MNPRKPASDVEESNSAYSWASKTPKLTDTAEQVNQVFEKPWHTRNLKVREGYHSYQLEQEKADRTPVAQILLKGHWLIEAGFDIDTPVTVEVIEGKLIITPISWTSEE